MGEELKELINKRDTILTEILRLKREQKRLLKLMCGKSEEYYVIEDALFMLREDLEDITKKMVEVLEKLSEKAMLCFKFNNLRQVRNYLMLLKIKPEAPLKPARGYYIIRLWKRDKQIRESLEREEITEEGKILGEDLLVVYYKDRRRLRKILKFIARNKLSLREL
jgi:hypothetical protein